MAAFTVDDPSAHFQVALYNGSAGLNLPKVVTNDGNSDLQPDLLWIKDREAGYSHALFDSSRGVNKLLYPDGQNSEVTTSSGNDLVSFNSDGFSVGSPSDANSTNGGTTSKLGFQWKANGGTTSTNSNGDINTTVQVNDDAGFSIVLSSNGNATARELGHGLSAAPSMVITRNRTKTSENWRVGVKHYANHDGSYNLDDTATFNNNAVLHTGTDSDSFGVGTDASVNGNYDYVHYVWREVKGYSKFGPFAGNNSSDGTFVYCGFRPALIFVKRRSNSGGWYMWNNKSSAFNMSVRTLRADIPDAEDVNNQFNLDMLSNGFKFRTTTASVGGAMETFFMAAFAERPFTTSSGVPTCAH